MTIGSPATWVNGTLTAAMLNAEVRDQLGALFEITAPTEATYTPTHTGWTIAGVWSGYYRTRGRRISFQAAFTFSSAPSAYPAGPSFQVSLPVAAGTRSYARLTAYLTWGNRPGMAFVTPAGANAFVLLPSTAASFPSAGQVLYVAGEYETA